VRVDRRVFLLTAAAAAGCWGKRDRSALMRAAQYLWAQQAADGGFHSTTYGLLRSGQSLTPFVLGALLRVSDATASAPAGAVDRALAFIRKHTSVDGAVGLTGGDADYPNYATALAVVALVAARHRLSAVAHRAKAGSWDADIAPMVAHLRAQQFSEANGWTHEHPAYGGWGMGGAIRRPPDAGHVDLSMTRFVLEALRASGVDGSDPAMSRARVFLERSQNHDGGFFFSPVTPALNKAGQRAEGFVSYGTTTADGVLALRASGVPDDDDRMARAIAWLDTHHRSDRVPGFDAGARPQASWRSGLRFYYAAALARARPQQLVRLPEQADDGSFRNDNGRVKEDDPLIATTFAIQMMARARSESASSLIRGTSSPGPPD
jgi:squalene-hopene/tetraprenyl-beta-curcumene cyclase